MDGNGAKLSFALGKPGTSSNGNNRTAFSFTKPKAPAAPRPAVAFGDDDDEEEGDEQPKASSSRETGAGNKALIAKSAAKSLSRQARKLQEEALKIDQSVFDYDEVWDGMQSAREAAKQVKQEEAAERKPKYIESFLQSASTRRLDRLRAEEKMLQHERDKEGDEFQDKEKFVTGAYKKQMEEVRKAEEEEKKKEEQDRLSKKGPGMTSFYRSMLDADEEKHRAAVEAASAAAALSSNASTASDSLAIRPPPKKKPVDPEYDDGEAEVDPFLLREAALRSAAQAKGPVVERLPATSTSKDANDAAAASGKLEVNDDGAIVDHRVLLKAGLNITKRPTSSAAAALEKRRAEEQTRYKSRAVGESASYAARNARERQRLEEQMREERERQAAEKRKHEEEDAERAKQRKLGGANAEEGEAKRKAARERFEERKRRKLEEEAKAKAEGRVAEEDD